MGLRFAVASLLFAALATANWNDTSTGVDLDKLPHFPLTKVRSGFLQAVSRATFDGMTAVATADPREVRLTGRGKSGKRWEAHFCCLDEVWRADLDGDGTQDYIFWGGGPLFNGRVTPLTSLSILMMDSQGLPVPFFTLTYDEDVQSALKHFVDLKRDGRAELLISSYDENVSDPRAYASFCSGHWVTQLYGFNALSVEEIRGTLGALTLPLIHDWTYGVSECGVAPTPVSVQPAVLYEHGTSASSEETGKILDGSDPNGFLKITPGAGCSTFKSNVIAYDQARVREIAFPNLFNSYQTNLAEHIQRDGTAVKLRGVSRGSSNCSVNLIWATGAE